jgi:hypothetical protein
MTENSSARTFTDVWLLINAAHFDFEQYSELEARLELTVIQENKIMELSNINPNEYTVMTEDLLMIFMAGGCNPTCHCCNSSIIVGQNFKLASVSQNLINKANNLDGRKVFASDKPHDVMICFRNECSPEKMVDDQIERLRSYKVNGLSAWGNPVRHGGCSIIDGKIVPG